VIPYIIAYGTILCAAVLIKKMKIEESKGNAWLAGISFFVIALLLGLRHPSMGVDLGYQSDIGYIASYKVIAGMSWRTVLEINSFLNYEKGFVVFCKLISCISDDAQFFIFVCSVCSFFSIFHIIKKYSPSPVFSILIYMGLPVFLAHFSAMRQVLALSICIYSITFIENKRIVKFIVTVLIASMFHFSAIFFLIAYLAYHCKMNASMRFFMLLFLPILFVLRAPIFKILSKVIADDAKIQENESGMFLLFLILIYVFAMLFFDLKDARVNGYMNILYIACLCQVFSSVYMTASRMSWFFMIAVILLLPIGLSTMRNKNDSKIIKLLMSIFFVAYGMYSIYVASWAESYPYHFFWEVI